VQYVDLYLRSSCSSSGAICWPKSKVIEHTREIRFLCSPCFGCKTSVHLSYCYYWDHPTNKYTNNCVAVMVSNIVERLAHLGAEIAFHLSFNWFDYFDHTCIESSDIYFWSGTSTLLYVLIYFLGRQVLCEKYLKCLLIQYWQTGIMFHVSFGRYDQIPFKIYCNQSNSTWKRLERVRIVFYGLAADRQEYCFTKDFFYIYMFFIILF